METTAQALAAARQHHLGHTFKAQGQLDQAVACYQEAIRLNPLSASAHSSLATALLDQGKLAEAMLALQQAIRCQRDDADSHHSRPIWVETAPGELIDKITILEIKRQRLSDTAKLRHVEFELATLAATRDRAVASSGALDRLTAELREVNGALWDIEDAIRGCERNGNFGQRFVELARSVYRQNDRRAALKRQINELLGSRIVEEKSYQAYQ